MRHKFNRGLSTRLVLLFGTSLFAFPACAVTLFQVDDFQDGSFQNWAGTAMAVVADAGPGGGGDFALEARTSGFPGGAASRLVIYSGGIAPVTTQWTGDWTAAGVTRLSFDVRNPNAFPLVLWLGIAGPLGSGFAGSTDTFLSNDSVIVPPDGAWHSAEFGALPADFGVWSSPSDAATALSNVSQLRIIHSPSRNWLGATGAATMLIDNIRVVPEPSALLLAMMGVVPVQIFRRSRSRSACT